MGQTPAPVGEAQIEHDGFTITSTTRSADDLRAETGSEPNEKGQQAADDTTGKPAGKPGSTSPPEPPAGKPSATDPQTGADTSKSAGAAAPPKPDGKAEPDPKSLPKGSPERRVAELQAKINQHTREMHQVRGETEAAKAEREQINQELADLRARRDALQREIDSGKKGDDKGQEKGDEKKPAAAAAKERRPRPNEDDFEDFREYLRADNDWVREQAVLDAEERTAAILAAERDKEQRAHEEERTKREEEEFAAARRELATKHRERIAQYEVENPDFPEIMKAAGALPTNPAMEEHILHSEMGPQLMRFFAENPQECERISKLGWGPTLVEIGKIEATKLGTAKSGSDPERRSTTRAEPPISPVRGGTHVEATDDDEDLSTMEFGPAYVAKMNAREREIKKRRRGL